MFNPQLIRRGVPTILLAFLTLPAAAQSFRVQCPTHTTLHPLLADGSANPHIKCQQISGGDGFATMGDGTQTYLFSFGPLSGLQTSSMACRAPKRRRYSIKAISIRAAMCSTP